MRLRRVILVLGGLTLLGLIAGIVALAVFAAGDAKSPAEVALEDCQSLAGQERLTEALAECDRAIEEDDGLVAAYVQRASVNASLGRFQEAYDDADSAVRIDEESAPAYAARARARVGLGEYSLAKRDIDRAEEAGADTALEWITLAEAYRSLGRWRAAARHAGEACDLGLASACDFSPIPSRVEGFDILHQLALTQYDLPTLTSGFSGYHTASETRYRIPWGITNQFDDWGFQLSYSAYFFDPIGEAGLSDVYCEIWLMNDSSRTEEFFDDISSYYGDAGDEIDFQEVGEDFKAYLFEGFEGDAVAPSEVSQVVIFRRGPYIAFLTATFIGAADQVETGDLARTVDEKLTGE